MSNYPEYIEVKNKQYKINTDYKVAIECIRIAEDETIGDFERMLGIIETLFGDDALDDCIKDTKLYEEFLKLAKRYLNCNKKYDVPEGTPDMDFIEDMDYIEASFMSDYHIDLENTNMHWWKFYNLINGLSNSELGNCCVLNNIRNLRNFDASKIEDAHERQKIVEAQSRVALKKYSKKENLTSEQEESMERLNKILGI